jgi:hypothetical protein
MVIGYDSFSELPDIHLGTNWTVRIAMQRTKQGKKFVRGQPGCALLVNTCDGDPEHTCDTLLVTSYCHTLLYDTLYC